MFEVPCMVVDIPGTRAAGCQSAPGDADFANEMAYIKSQVKELIETCERVTGKKFDIDRLRQNMGYANRITRAWRKVLDYNMSRPAVFNALTDGTVYLGVSNCLGGSEEGALYFERLEEEMAYRVANGIGATRNMDGTEELAEQRFRLAFIGVPCYPIFKNFNEMFTKWGGVFVNSAYLTFASGGADMGFEYDLANPIDSLAEGLLRRIRETMDQLFFGCPDIETQASRFGLDGIVYHPIKSCRTISAGLADRRHHMAEDLGLATLYFESDMVDPRVVAEAQMRNRVDAFFEGLATREIQSRGAA
jgi:benzoyl-CoA reductase subunit B